MPDKPFAARYGPLIIGAVAIFVLDQYTKYLVRQNFTLYETMPVIENFFNLIYIENPGAAFGFMANYDSAWVGRVFIIISFIAIALVLAIYREVESEDPYLKVSLILIMGGAIGNLADRFMIGKVTDFLDFHLGGHHWPAFNVADSCITIGVTIMLVSWVIPLLNRKPE